MNIAGTSAPRSERFFHLVGGVRSDLRGFIRKEIELAKAELGENFQTVARNGMLLAAGTVLGLMALFLLLLAGGAAVALGLISAGLEPGAAYLAAYGGLAVLLGLAAALLVRKAVHALKGVSLAPRKTIEAVKGAPDAGNGDGGWARRSLNEIETDVELTRARLDAEVHELRQRFKPGYAARSTAAGVKHHPMRTGLLIMGAGLGMYWMMRKGRR